jgi:hypothetical protein
MFRRKYKILLWLSIGGPNAEILPFAIHLGQNDNLVGIVRPPGIRKPRFAAGAFPSNFTLLVKRNSLTRTA